MNRAALYLTALVCAAYQAPPQQATPETVTYRVYLTERLAVGGDPLAGITRLPHVTNVETHAGSASFKLTMPVDKAPDVEALERVLDGPRVWSLRREGSTDTLADLRRMTKLLRPENRLSRDDVAYLRMHDPRTQRRLEVQALLGQVAALYRAPAGLPTNLGGNSTFMALLSSFEAYVAMTQARGLPVEFEPLRSDAEIPARVAAILEKYGEQHVFSMRESKAAAQDKRLRHMLYDKPVQEMADRIERVTLQHYRLQLAEVVAECDAILERLEKDTRARQQIQALRTCAEGMRRILF